MRATDLKVHLIAWTTFQAPPPAAVPGWHCHDAVGGQALIEFAGRACYQSWSKPNPATATNAGYIHHLLDVGHMSVLEHGTATFYFTGVSRSLTHELIRHRHFSYSQLSQRYVADEGLAIEPEVIAAEPYLHSVWTNAVTAAEQAYRELVHGLERHIAATGGTTGAHEPVDVGDGTATGKACASCLTQWPCPPATQARTAARKQARQAARSVLPNATETRIVVTGNYRAWRHFINMRATEHADVEIREAAITLLQMLQAHAPNVFGDFHIVEKDDGVRYARSYIEEQD